MFSSQVNLLARSLFTKFDYLRFQIVLLFPEVICNSNHISLTTQHSENATYECLFIVVYEVELLLKRPQDFRALSLL